MIFEFLKKQKELKQRKQLIITLIESINIHEEQKFLYLESLDVLSIQDIDSLYIELTRFMEDFELKEIDEINKQNFASVAGLRKKEAQEKKTELNTFSFLINNI